MHISDAAGTLKAMDDPNEIHLSERQRNILRIIIEEYVATTHPVASEYIVSRYGLNVSSATVRNEMVELEQLGLIVQPHTSAGRVPSDLGYRFFVENLMVPGALSADEQRKIRHQFHQVELDSEECIRLAASVLARSTHNAGMATAPLSAGVRLKHFELLAVSDARILVVLVGSDGSVTQQMMPVEEYWEQERLSSLASQLNVALFDRTATEVEAWANDEENRNRFPSIAEKVLPVLTAMLARLERPDISRIYHEGLVHMLEQPEFRQPRKMQQVLELFEHGGIWSSIIASAIGREGVHVIIGDEALGEGMASYSVVLTRYGLEGKLAGVLGVVGPTRMPYSRSVSTVTYMSELLSDLLYKGTGAYHEPAGEEQ